MDIQAVVFDLDGLMIESEQYHFDALKELLARYDKQASPEWFHSMIGMDNEESAQFVLAQTGIPLTPDAFNDMRYEIITSLLPRIYKPKAGLLDLLQAVGERGLGLSIASNSRRDYVTKALMMLGILNDFECVITSGDVAHAKPAPDVYLAAASCLGNSPEQCLAVEDSPHGMQAALGAGMPCVAVPNPDLQDLDFKGATFIFSFLVEFLRSLDQVLK
jgi:HAD superfamily hydrolase (TIGR01509 family)